MRIADAARHLQTPLVTCRWQRDTASAPLARIVATLWQQDNCWRDRKAGANCGNIVAACLRHYVALTSFSSRATSAAQRAYNLCEYRVLHAHNLHAHATGANCGRNKASLRQYVALT